MPAYKYSSVSNYNPFIQASIKPQMGKNYAFNGRLYCQVKNAGKISYSDAVYSLAVRLASWTTDSVDIELEIRGFNVSASYSSSAVGCDPIMKLATALDGVPLYIRINNKGQILKILNVVDVAKAYDIQSVDEYLLIEKIEQNPIISAFVSGQIEQSKSEKIFSSNILSSKVIESDIKLNSKKQKFGQSKESSISTMAVHLNKEQQQEVGDSQNYYFNASATSYKGVDSVLAFSIDYSTEEKLGEDQNTFVSIGLEKVVLEKDIDIVTRIYTTLLKNVSAIF